MEEDAAKTLQFTADELAEHLACPVCCRWLSSAFNTSCGHLLCGNCIVKWLQHSGTCPVCRTVLETAPSRCFSLEAFLHERLLPQLDKDAPPSSSDSPAQIAKAVAAAFGQRRHNTAPQPHMGQAMVAPQTVYDGVRAPASLYEGSWGSSDDEDEGVAPFGGTLGSPPASPLIQHASASQAAISTPQQQQPHEQQHHSTRRHDTHGRFRVVTFMEGPTVQHWQMQPVNQHDPSPPMPQLTLRTTARDFYHHLSMQGARAGQARQLDNDTGMQRDQ